MYSLEKRPISFFSAAKCYFCLDLLLTGGLLNYRNFNDQNAGHGGNVCSHCPRPVSLMPVV